MTDAFATAASRRGLPTPAIVALAIAGVALIFIAPFLVKNYRVFQFNLVLIYAVAILGLNILTGYTGLLSIGHAAFNGIGAYGCAVAAGQWGWPFWLAVPFGGVVAAAVEASSTDEDGELPQSHTAERVTRIKSDASTWLAKGGTP